MQAARLAAKKEVENLRERVASLEGVSRTFHRRPVLCLFFLRIVMGGAVEAPSRLLPILAE